MSKGTQHTNSLTHKYTWLGGNYKERVTDDYNPVKTCKNNTIKTCWYIHTFTHMLPVRVLNVSHPHIWIPRDLQIVFTIEIVNV